MWYVCDMLYVCVSCFVMRGCAVSRKYIDVCYCDMFSVVNVYHDYLKLCVVCINGRKFVCCGECYGVSNMMSPRTVLCNLCFGCGGVWGGEWVVSLGQGLGGWLCVL